MKVGTSVRGKGLSEVPDDTAQAEKLGYDFISTSETKHNPFLAAVLASEHSTKMNVRTSIALAFARSPMDTAYMAWDLQGLAGGRFHLGLGSQVRGHIVRRFNMPWGRPAARMREYILALRAIWASWQQGAKLDFRGDFYNFNLMPPFFDPGPIEYPDIKVYVAAVNERMQQVAGEVSDGVLLHSFNTPKHTREVVLPNLEKGAAKAGKTLADLDIHGGGFIVTGADDEELEARVREAKSSISFYASTRSYASVMNTHGWNDTAQKLYRMSVEGQWSQMGEHITDEMLEAFAVVGTYDNIVDRIKARHGPYASSISFSIPIMSPEDGERLREMIRRLKAD